MQTRFAAALLAGALAAPALADDVHLTNGKTFEGVIAEETGNRVLIRMPAGQLTLPKSQVARIEKSDSYFGEYLRRRSVVERGGTAAEWLELARWARANGLEHGTREAALRAAELAPDLAGLAPLLSRFGYAYDREAGRWLTHEESMRRRGFVLAEGEWMTREEAAARRRAREEELARANAERQAARAARVARQTAETELALAEIRLRREVTRPEVPTYPYYPGYPVPVVVFPGFFFDVPEKPSPKNPFPNKPSVSPDPSISSNSFNRQPGSLIPGMLGRSSSSRRP